MRADFQNYRNAASVSVKGLAFQAVSALVMLAYGAISGDAAAFNGSVFVAMGCVAWLALWVVYDQHRRERIEAMEAEALAQAPGGGTSVFESREEFRPAAKRLAGLYRIFVPVVSIVIAFTLAGVGLWRAWAAYQYEQVGTFGNSAKPGWALGLGVAFAALGFIGARYVAGLSKQTVWANLRGGAAWTIGSSLVWFLLAAGHLLKYVNSDVLVKHLPLVVAGLMMLVGLETFVNFLLALYRPRRVGETPRPAFDSNILALFATPDRVVKSVGGAISYQLGFDVTSGWLYQLLSRRLPLLVAIGLVVIWLLTGIVVIQPHQEAMILRWGRPVGGAVGPGLHLKAPWPIDEVYVPEYFVKDKNGRNRLQDKTVTGLRRVELGTQPPATTEPILWTNDHIGPEMWQYVRIGDAPQGSRGLTDVAVVSIEIPMQYTVSDVRLFDELGPTEQREALIQSVARREVTRFFQGVTIDEVLGGDRAALSNRLREKVEGALAQLNKGEDGKPRGAGVHVDMLAITGAHPPKDVAQSFETPVQAAQRREANIYQAQTDAAKKLTEVAGDAALAGRIVAEISAYEALGNRLKAVRGQPEAGPISLQITEQELKITALLNQAQGGASRVLSEARAARWNRTMTARRDAVRYQGQLAIYEAAPEVFKMARYFDTLRAIMKDTRVFIVPDSVRDMRSDIDLHDADLGLDIFRSKDQGN